MAPANEAALTRGCALHARGQDLRDAGDLSAARRSLSRALNLLRGALGPNHPDVANVLIELAGTHRDAGDWRRALPLAAEAAAILGRSRARGPVEPLRCAVYLEYGDLLLQGGRYRDALTPLRRAARIAEACEGDAVAAAYNALGVAHRHLGRFDEAAAYYQRALAQLGPRASPRMVATLAHNLGGLEHARGRPALGVPHGRRAVRVRAALLGPRHPAVAADEAALASLLEGCGRLAEAERLYRRALATFRARLGPRHLEVGFNLGNLAALEQRRGRHAAAARLYRRALAIQEEAGGRWHPHLALLLSNYAALCRARGRPTEAAAAYRRAAMIYARALGPRHPDAAAARRAAAEAEAAAGG